MPSCLPQELWLPNTAWFPTATGEKLNHYCHQWYLSQTSTPYSLPTHRTIVSSPGFDSHTLSQPITNLLISQQAWQCFSVQPALLGDSRACSCFREAQEKAAPAHPPASTSSELAFTGPSTLWIHGDRLGSRRGQDLLESGAATLVTPHVTRQRWGMSFSAVALKIFLPV